MTSLLFYGIPVLIYALVVWLRERVGLRNIASRLGLVPGPARYYGWALGILLLTMAWHLLSKRWFPALGAFQKFAGQPLTFSNVLRALEFGLLATGLGEELLFRGLIGGWLGRRLRFWVANGIQAFLFTLPHLLLLLEAPHLWPLVSLTPFLFGLAVGWLRLKSGSIFPGWIVHGGGNVFVAVMAMA